MKKIIALILAMLMVASFSVVAFAEGEAVVVTMADGELTVGAEGTITLDLVAAFAAETTVGLVAWEFVLPEGVSIAEYNLDAWKAFMDSAVTDDSALPTITVYEDDMTTVVPAGTVAIPVTFTVDTSVAKEFTITANPDNAMIADVNGEPMNDIDALPVATITVKAAGPVVAEETVEEAVEVNAEDITVNGQVYSNVAVFDGSIVLPAPDAEKGESITAAGIKLDGNEVKNFLPEFSGGGSVTYRVLFYGITDTEAETFAARLKTYYTGNFIQD